MEIDLNLAVCDEIEKNACGAVTILPKKGDLVVYFPQGHLEVQANTEAALPWFDLPPQILCRVVDVQLIANKENDEVYAQLSLDRMPQTEMGMGGVKLEGKERVEEGGINGGEATSHMFCKTLTASDTSTHGGFSVPRRAAEDCFPPLNYEEQRPSQEVVATDLHGVEWKFRHIYRGQPRRHLLTTGWSIFVNQKNLVSGDAVLFLRGEAGELRLGIRRATRPTNDSINKNVNVAANANAMFNVVYSPRATHSAFIVPYQKYLQCTASPVPVGTRFKMNYHLDDDSPQTRFTGVVTGVSDADPYRWPNSKWRSLMVRWDHMVDRQERVSPWDINIDPSRTSYANTPLALSIHPFPGMKRLRSNPSPDATSFSRGDLVSVRSSSKVLQGQENVGFMSDRPITAPPNRMEKIISNGGEFARNPGHPTFTGFPKVLQGQEICSFRSLARLKPRHFPTPIFYPLVSEGSRNLAFFKDGHVPPMLSSFSDSRRRAATEMHPANEWRALEKTSANMNSRNGLELEVPICKVFGFSLTEDHATLNAQGQSKRSCTKVHKQGSRAMNLSQLHRYDSLLSELERLFSMEEGLVHDPSHGPYAGSDNDMVVGVRSTAVSLL
ncbi:hypothetical protein C2S52_017235 [Perilla frutescens var. hirtella]|nr:hypothetical protein C2S52_017235 [Perilla frutescens var. hirtella]